MNFSTMKVKEIKTYLDKLSMEELADVLLLVKTDSRLSMQKLAEKYQKKVIKHQEEVKRIKQLYRYENMLYQKGIQYVAGVDEAGRGPLAGPVFAAAVILPPHIVIEGINDSKKLSEKKREELFDIIIEKAVSYKIVSVSEQEIDRINIKNAAYKAMVCSVEKMKVKPQHVLVDGNDIEGLAVPHTNIVKGDSLSISIAAASILAKVTRDRLIKDLDAIYPQYGFAKHKGYGTKEHIEAIRKYGICPVHRKSFTEKFIEIG